MAVGNVVIPLARREGAAMLAEQMLDWAPEGVLGVNDAD